MIPFLLWFVVAFGLAALGHLEAALFVLLAGGLLLAVQIIDGRERRDARRRNPYSGPDRRDPYLSGRDRRRSTR